MITYRETEAEGGSYMGPMILSNEPIGNDIQCPMCADELMDCEPGKIYGEKRIYTPISCDSCGFASMRRLNGEVVDKRNPTSSIEYDAKKYSRLLIMGYNATDKEVEERAGEETKFILEKVETAYIAGRNFVK